MVEGESGLLSIFDDSELRGGSQDTAWNRSMRELFLADGSRFKVFSSEKPRTLRGPQHHFAWVDEPATFYDAHKGSAEDTTWSNLVFGCRLTSAGSTPQIVATGTPKPVKLLTQRPTDDSPPGLLYRVSTAITRGHSDDNLANLAESYRREVIDPLRDTRLGRQELAAEVLEDVEGAVDLLASLAPVAASPAGPEAALEQPRRRAPVPAPGGLRDQCDLSRVGERALDLGAKAAVGVVLGRVSIEGSALQPAVVGRGVHAGVAGGDLGVVAGADRPHDPLLGLRCQLRRPWRLQ